MQTGTRIRDSARWLPRLALRRSFPRFEVDGSFLIEDANAVDPPVELMDVSLGGFRSSSSVDLPPGTVRTFRFALGPEDAVTPSASVVHCYAAHGRTDAFTVGWIWKDPRVNVEGVPIDALAILDYLSSGHSPVRLRPTGRGRLDPSEGRDE